MFWIRCKLFIETDKFFKGKIIRVNKFNSSINLYHQYCRNGKYSNNNEQISALSRHLFMKLKKSRNQYYGYFTMYLSDK
ncbi:hypothetical protein YYE_04761 [Plasmodium vinckei vinckei]|uniref:PIR protein CIR protein n=1 Tax=Plasmodium vinckei vinckei TaxID=54757 RepID=A0A081I992_PLAVN|nr:hypothetical protein YYE_04761 [Plasmodium vinckei vinckei]